MSVKNSTTHVVLPNQLTVYLRERSAVWQCAYAVDGIWQRMSTGKRDLDEAKKQAHEILVEAKYRKKINQAPITRQFKDIAKHVVKRMTDELAAGGGKPIFKDYLAVLDKYLVPFFGKYKIDSIDFALLQKYDSWRLKRMKKEPTYSTVLTHNAALNRVFDEAEQRKFLMPTSRPTLVVKGKKSERRPAFTIEEVGAMRNNFDAWIEMARADQRPLRAMLRDYVEVLLDTGARPGVELMDLTWVHVELTVEPEFIETGEKVVEQDEVEDVIDLRANRGVFLNIQTGKTSKVGKTKGRSALGRSPTLRALRRIATNNYGVKMEELLERGCTDHIFYYREFLNKNEIAAKKQARLIKPTSFTKLFTSFLKDYKLLIDPITKQPRTFYSLRHTYATVSIEHDSIHLNVLADQMGTSYKMIDDYYSHATAKSARHQLRGDASRELIRAKSVANKKYQYSPSDEDTAALKKPRKTSSRKSKKT